MHGATVLVGCRCAARRCIHFSLGCHACLLLQMLLQHVAAADATDVQGAKKLSYCTNSTTLQHVAANKHGAAQDDAEDDVMMCKGPKKTAQHTAQQHLLQHGAARDDVMMCKGQKKQHSTLHSTLHNSICCSMAVKLLKMILKMMCKGPKKNTTLQRVAAADASAACCCCRCY